MTINAIKVTRVPVTPVTAADTLSKRVVRSIAVVASTDSGPEEIIRATCFMGLSANSSQVLAKVYAPGHFGQGKAAGYGYDKRTASIIDALLCAGFDVRYPCGAETALLAVAEFLSPGTPKLCVSVV
jgi:hypothetical protein